MQVLFRCDFCGKEGTKKELRKHEKDCLYNPKNKSCATCIYGKSYGAYYSNNFSTFQNFSCTYTESPTSLSIKIVGGEPCEHYTQRYPSKN